MSSIPVVGALASLPIDLARSAKRIASGASKQQPAGLLPMPETFGGPQPPGAQLMNPRGDWVIQVWHPDPTDIQRQGPQSMDR